MDNILLGGLSSSFATVFTNPLEVSSKFSVKKNQKFCKFWNISGGENSATASRRASEERSSC